MKDFILRDKDFFDLAKRYTFQYREFSPYIDYLEVVWNRKEKDWEFGGEGYYCHNSNEQLPIRKNSLFLNLSIEGYSWGSLFNKMEEKFIENLKINMSETDIDELMEKDYERYSELRDDYFKINKENIVDDWFKLKEGALQNYIQNQFKSFKELFLNSKKIIY